jgi:hypothetical protein
VVAVDALVWIHYEPIDSWDVTDRRADQESRERRVRLLPTECFAASLYQPPRPR